MVKVFKQPYDIIYIKCHESAINLNYNIYKEDISEGIILFKVGWSLLSFGERFKIVITYEAGTSKVEVVSEAAIKAQLIDWGKNNENINNFFKTLSALLNS